MALLVEGLGTGADTSIEEYVIGPANDEEVTRDKDQIMLYGAEQGQSWIAKPVTGQSMLGMASRHGAIASRHGSMAQQGSMANMMDPLVTLFGSVHEKLPQTGSMRGSFFPNFGSMFNAAAEEQGKHDHWEVRSQDEGSSSDVGDGDSDDNLKSPLLSRGDSGVEKDVMPQSGSIFMRRNSSLMQSGTGELVNSTGIN